MGVLKVEARGAPGGHWLSQTGRGLEGRHWGSHHSVDSSITAPPFSVFVVI